MKSVERRRVGFPREKARKVLDEYFSKNPPFHLPIPVHAIAQFYQFEVYELNNLNRHQRAIKIEFPTEGRRLIGVNSTYHRHNQRFSLGHEMGHHFLEHPAEDACDEGEIKIYNGEADEFSAELLIPIETLKNKLKEIKDVSTVAKLFDVSEQAIWIKITSRRLLNTL